MPGPQSSLSHSRLYNASMFVYLVSGAIVLPGALLLLLCRYDLIDANDLCLRAHFLPLMFLALFTNIGGGAAIAILLIFRGHLLITLPAVLLALNALALWTNIFWLGKVIPSELHDPIFYAGNAVYATVALFAGVVWLIRSLKSSDEDSRNE